MNENTCVSGRHWSRLRLVTLMFQWLNMRGASKVTGNQTVCSKACSDQPQITWNLHIDGPLWGETTSEWWVSLTKGQCKKVSMPWYHLLIDAELSPYEDWYYNTRMLWWWIFRYKIFLTRNLFNHEVNIPLLEELVFLYWSFCVHFID